MEVQVERLADGGESRARLLKFLISIEDEFNPPLSEFLSLEDYVHKVMSEGEVGVITDSTPGEILGAVIFYCNPAQYRNGWISVIASRRKRAGMGRNLLLFAVERCRQKKMKGVEIQTWESNVASRALFDAAGFIFVEFRDNRQGGTDRSAFYRLEFNRDVG